MQDVLDRIFVAEAKQYGFFPQILVFLTIFRPISWDIQRRLHWNSRSGLSWTQSWDVSNQWMILNDITHHKWVIPIPTLKTMPAVHAAPIRLLSGVYAGYFEG